MGFEITDANKKIQSRFRRPHKHRFSLVWVTRQIYAEAAILPYTLSTFAFYCLEDIKAWTAIMTLRQLKLVRCIRNLGLGVLFSQRATTSLCQSGFASLNRIEVKLLRGASHIEPPNPQLDEWVKGLEVDLSSGEYTHQRWWKAWLVSSGKANYGDMEASTRFESHLTPRVLTTLPITFVICHTYSR
jgi:hypothetical protein